MPRTTRYLGTCAACQREIKVRDGKLVHHGYKRPGIGYIVGDCLGAGGLPHELSPVVAQAVLKGARGAIQRNERLLHELPRTDTLPKQITERGRGAWAPIVRKWIEVARDDVDDTEWAWLYRRRYSQLERELKFWQEEAERAGQWVRDWTLQPLRTVKEEQSAKRQAQAAREAEKLAKWQAQADKKVEFYRKRLDGKLVKLERARNDDEAFDIARDIAEIYVDAPSKLRDVMHDRISFVEAKGMLGLHEVYQRLGFPPTAAPHGYQQQRAAASAWLEPFRLRLRAYHDRQRGA